MSLADTREVTLAVIPTGTGNDWARTLGISRRPADIARAIAGGRTMLHDVGAIDLPGRNPARRWFINVAGAGYDAYVTERVPRPVPGAFTYLRIALEGLARYRALHFRITADGETLDGPLLLAFVANAQYCGNRMHVVPTARTDDGHLDVLAVRELSLLAVWPKLVKLYSGRILGDHAVRHLRAQHVRIETEPPAVIQADGQIAPTFLPRHRPWADRGEELRKTLQEVRVIASWTLCPYPGIHVAVATSAPRPDRAGTAP